jgi:glycosyltransferase involved in cell wall biosynthesis
MIMDARNVKVEEVQKQIKVVHLTSVHPPFDNRIFYKECRSLAAAGFDVVLIAPHERSETVEGVYIKGISKPANRLERMTKTAWNIFRAARSEDAQIYHFHDPELISVGFLLRMSGSKVIYDVHEEFYTSVLQKPYLPRLARPILAVVLSCVERILQRFFHIVLAERYYTRRFPRGTTVLNYPVYESIDCLAGISQNRNTPRFIYTGGITADRGAYIHAGVVNQRKDVEVHFVGRCAPETATRMREIAGANADRIFIEGEGHFVPHRRILERYREGGWMGGLAIFPPTPHYIEKELTKFFEYMAAGIPVICSNFPRWRSLIEQSGVGLCVEPENSEQIQKAISYLVEHPHEARAMGERGQRAVREHFNWRSEEKHLLQLYKRILAS